MFISANKSKYPITVLCKTLKVTRSYYYKVMKLANAINESVNQEELIDAEVERIFNDNNGVYGSR